MNGRGHSHPREEDIKHAHAIANAPVPPVAPSELDEEMGRLREGLHHLDSLLIALRDRLQPVLRDAVPTPAGATAEAKATAPLTLAIRLAVGDIAQLIDAVVDLRVRLVC